MIQTGTQFKEIPFKISEGNRNLKNAPIVKMVANDYGKRKYINNAAIGKM